MAETTNISWCDGTANFWWGCQKISPGCRNCYADVLSRRYGKNIWGSPARSGRELKKSIWTDIIKWDRESGEKQVRRRIFVQSMSDFLEDNPAVVEWRKRAIGVIESLQWTDILILTKRPENARVFLSDWYSNWPAHVWFGVSVENQEYADIRIPHLMGIPARVLFLSCEPLLAPIDLRRWLIPNETSINWVIVGGESGQSARPFDVSWARTLRDQSKNVAFFMKQLGSNPVGLHGAVPRGKGDKLQSLPLDLQIREIPA